MKIAIFADIHGNLAALEAVLYDIEHQNVDVTVCAGDIVNPLPGSRQSWDLIRDRQIPLVVGNQNVLGQVMLSLFYMNFMPRPSQVLYLSGKI